jgi:hypothetical protein
MRNLSSFTLKNGIGIHIQALNTRLLTITPVSAQYELLDENKKLIGLDYNGEYLISKGSVITVGKQKYKINEVRKSNTSITGYELYTFRKVSTTGNFIFPLLGGDRSYWRWRIEFTNAFIGDEINHDGTEISLLYRFDGSKNFSDFEAMLTKRPDFISASDPDKYHTIYKFKIDKKYSNEVQLIITGKYSMLSNATKERIMEFHNSDRSKPIGQVLFKCTKRKQKIEQDIGQKLPDSAELLDMFTLSDEIYKKQFIIQEKDDYRTTSTTSDFI